MVDELKFLPMGEGLPDPPEYDSDGGAIDLPYGTEISGSRWRSMTDAAENRLRERPSGR